MIPQGFPLYAVDPEYPDTVYVVVGWLHGRMPILVPLTHGARGGQATREPSEDRTYRFTTTDPSERPERTAGSVYGYSMDELAKKLECAETLRYRMAAIADDLEDAGPSHIAARIRGELNK